MVLRVAINGLGRIGRLVFRAACQRDDIEIVAVNDLVDAENLAYLIQYDSVHGPFEKSITGGNGILSVGERRTQVFSEKDPASLPWRDLKIDYVIEATGRFTHYDEAQKHLEAGAKKVIISSPAKGEIPTFVMGVNHTKYNPSQDHIVSNASCTTNCLAPLAKVLLDNFGIEEGLMTTIHAVTATQPVVDGASKKDFRAGRSALQNIIPSSTGAAKAVGLCIPEIQGKLTGMAFRVPVINVSCVDLTVKLEKSTSYSDICEVLKQASKSTLKGILGYTDQPNVSSDFIGSTYSSIFDETAGLGLNDKFYKLISWYDNEVGYSYRILDLMCFMASRS